MLAIRSPETKRINSARIKRDQAPEVDLNFYSEVPSYELSLDEFEEMALARLKVRKKSICFMIYFHETNRPT